MVTWHLRSRRSPSGALRQRLRKKRRMDRGMEFLQTRVAPRKALVLKARGGKPKVRLLSTDIAMVADPKAKTIAPSKILSVVSNAANPLYIRRNILTKGAVIKTEAGLARVTSRPSQHGVVNAVLLEKAEQK